MSFLYFISFGSFLTGFLIFIIVILFNIKKHKISLTKRKANNYAILIPARDESHVIEELLLSIKKQTDLKDTYVIVEDKKDKTCDIVRKYNGNIIVRKNLNLKTKGHALDEAFKHILKSKHYDLYFIMDADNVLENNFFTEMIKSYEKGYDLATSYRNIKNPINVITACSELTFTMINTFANKHKTKKNKSIIVSGTGYYISGDLIEKWQGFPFNTLTEDYEFSLYISSNNIPCCYNEKTSFYDEQPDNMNLSIIQRTRWVKGFLQSRKKRLDKITDIGKLAGITPYLFMIVGVCLFIINNIISMFLHLDKLLIYIGINVLVILLIYILLLLFTLLLFIIDKKRMNLSFKLKLQAIFFNPIFLFTYIICLFKSKKDIQWDKIEHKEKSIKNA